MYHFGDCSSKHYKENIEVLNYYDLFNGEIGNTVRKIEPFFKDLAYIIQTPPKKNVNHKLFIK